jgi:hypothetical protein
MFISIKKRGTIQGKKRCSAFLRLSLIMERVSRKMLEKDFWDVSSMKRNFLTTNFMACNSHMPITGCRSDHFQAKAAVSSIKNQNDEKLLQRFM